MVLKDVIGNVASIAHNVLNHLATDDGGYLEEVYEEGVEALEKVNDIVELINDQDRVTKMFWD